VTDPLLGYPPGAPSTPTVHGILHTLLSLFGTVSLAAACFVLAWRDAADPARRGWAFYSVATGLAIAVFFVLTNVFALLNGPAELVQRTNIIVGGCWFALLAIRLMSRSVPRVSVE